MRGLPNVDRRLVLRDRERLNSRGTKWDLESLLREEGSHSFALGRPNVDFARSLERSDRDSERAVIKGHQNCSVASKAEEKQTANP
jgi:hypothetical protein